MRMKKIHVALEIFMCLHTNCSRTGKTAQTGIIPIYNPLPLITVSAARLLSPAFVFVFTPAFIHAVRHM